MAIVGKVVIVVHQNAATVCSVDRRFIAMAMFVIICEHSVIVGASMIVHRQTIGAQVVGIVWRKSALGVIWFTEVIIHWLPIPGGIGGVRRALPIGHMVSISGSFRRWPGVSIAV